MYVFSYLCKTELENGISHLISATVSSGLAPLPNHLFLQKHLFWYSLKMPAYMIIIQILFNQKCCTLY